MKMQFTAVIVLILTGCACLAGLHADEAVRWPERSGHRMVTFQDALFITGGLYAFEKNFFFNDVWTSGDGALWSRTETEAPYTPSRQLHASLVFGDHIWVMGGQSNIYLNDVWRSGNGQDWETVTAAAPWLARRGMAAVVHNDRMFILGGEDVNHEYNSDVWASADGINWELMTGEAAWAPRWECAAVSFGNAVFVMGGVAESGKYNDVWRSTDGGAWTKVGTLPMAVRGHCAEVFKDKIFVFGGVGENDQLLNELWSSADGVSWTIVELNALWPARTRHASAVFKKRLWLAGGTLEKSDSNDVWSSRDGAGWQAVTDAGGCGCAGDDSNLKSWRYFLGDVLLLGVSLLVLSHFKRRDQDI